MDGEQAVMQSVHGQPPKTETQGTPTPNGKTFTEAHSQSDKPSMAFSQITNSRRFSRMDATNSVESLEPHAVRVSKKSFHSFIRRHTKEEEKSKEADKFIRRIRRDKELFDGKMFMIKKEEQQQRRRRASLKEMDHAEQSIQERKKKLGGIFQNLEEYENRKKRRKEEIEKFRQDLGRLQRQKPLYQLKEEQYMLKHELPVILEREEKLQEVKLSRKPIDWQKEMNAFQDKIFQLKRQQPDRVHRPPMDDDGGSVNLYKSRFYHSIEQSRSSKKTSPDSKAIIHKRRKDYSKEVKYYIEPHMLVRVRSTVDQQQRKPSTSKETQQMLGKQYLQYSKGYGSRKRYNTERTLKQEKNSFTVSTSLDVHQAEAAECTEQEHNTISLSTKPILTAEDEQEYISDIKVKLEMLRYLAK